MSLARNDLPETAAFASIFEEYGPRIWRAVRHLGVVEADVEDVCQEVFLAVHRGLGRFREESSVWTWIYGICVRQVGLYRRRPYRRRESPLGDELPEGTVPALQERDAETNQLLEKLYAALDQMDDDKRTVYVLYELEGGTMAEVAQIVGCPLQTAYSRLYAARRFIDAAFADRKEAP